MGGLHTTKSEAAIITIRSASDKVSRANDERAIWESGYLGIWIFGNLGPPTILAHSLAAVRCPFAAVNKLCILSPL